MIRNVKNKISIDELYNEFKYQEEELKKRIDKLTEKSSDIKFKTWEQILKELSE